jgi:hypothetical protein
LSEYRRLFQTETNRLGLWLLSTVQEVLAPALNRFLNTYSFQVSLKDLLDKIITTVYLMQTQGVNLCLEVERSIAPFLVRKLGEELVSVLEDDDAQESFF